MPLSTWRTREIWRLRSRTPSAVGHRGVGQCGLAALLAAVTCWARMELDYARPHPVASQPPSLLPPIPPTPNIRDHIGRRVQAPRRAAYSGHAVDRCGGAHQECVPLFAHLRMCRTLAAWHSPAARCCSQRAHNRAHPQLPVLTRLALDKSSMRVLHHQDVWLNKVLAGLGCWGVSRVAAQSACAEGTAMWSFHPCMRGGAQREAG